eukprot:gene1768-33183_t
MVWFSRLSQKPEQNSGLVLNVVSKARAEQWFGPQREVVTEAMGPGSWAFHKAEPQHQNLYERSPGSSYCISVVAPKIERMEAMSKVLPLLRGEGV